MKSSSILLLTVIFGATGASTMPSDASELTYEGYYLFLSDYPYARDNEAWTNEVQGLAHDSGHWFIANKYRLIKWPVWYDLNAKISSWPHPPLLDRHIGDDRRLEGFNHFGDPDHLFYMNQGYLFVPVEGKPVPAIAVFSGRDLSYLCMADVPAQGGHAPWCAVYPILDADILYLFSSGYGNVSSLLKYRIDIETLRIENRLDMGLVGDFPIYDEAGSRLTLQYLQGGAFSQSGRLLFIVNGDANDDQCDCGIHVFDVQTGKRVARSSQDHRPFLYQFNPGRYTYEEPEGLDVWDLDHLGVEVPGASGQLHVVMLDNDPTDDVYIKHYTNTLCVNPASSTHGEGLPFAPFRTVTEAYNYAWDGARIKIWAGGYQESVTVSKQVQIVAENGTAKIGTTGRVSLSPSGVINISDTGVIKTH